MPFSTYNQGLHDIDVLLPVLLMLITWLGDGVVSAQLPHCEVAVFTFSSNTYLTEILCDSANILFLIKH